MLRSRLPGPSLPLSSSSNSIRCRATPAVRRRITEHGNLDLTDGALTSPTLRHTLRENVGTRGGDGSKDEKKEWGPRCAQR